MGHKPFSLSIRGSMLLLVTILAATALLAIVDMGLRRYAESVHRLEMETAKLTDDIAADFKSRVNSAKEMGETLSLLPDVQQGQVERIEPLLQKLIAQSPIYANILIMNQTGVVWASGIPMHGKTVSMADRKLFIDAMATGRFSSGEFALGKTSGKPVMNFGYPLVDAGSKPWGCIAMGFNLEYFQSTFNKAMLPPDSLMVLLDHKGMILYSSFVPADFIGKPYPPDEFKAMQADSVASTHTGTGLDGRKHIASYAKLSLESGAPPYLYIRVSTPFETIAENIRNDLAPILLALLATMLLLVAGAWYMSRRFVLRPLSLLAEAITQVSKGDLTIRLRGQINVQELEPIRLAFNSMTLRLTENIAQRNKAEEALHMANLRFAEVLNSIDALIYVSDMHDHEILFINRYGLKIWGNITGKLCWQTIQTAQEGPCPFCTNHLLLGPDGKPAPGITYEFQNTVNKRWYECTDKAIQWPDGRTVRLEIAVDITRRKQLESEQENMRNQLHQAQKIESIGRLAGGVAHDFNNILMAIMGNAEMALELVDPALPIHRNLKEILKSAQRSADLTRQLLAFARKQTISPCLLALNELIAGMLKMLRRLIGEDIELIWKPGAGLWPVKMDPSQIDQILVNLAVNARDAIAGVGSLTIESRNLTIPERTGPPDNHCPPGEYVCLQVTDSGCGMDAEVLNHLFEPFFTTKEVGKGTGLGLATVYGIVKQNSGHIQVESRPGQGTTFLIYLPRASKSLSPAAAEPAQAPPRGGTETILFVEDEAAILLLGRSILERYGYKVLTAVTPQEALGLVESHPAPIHLLITDVILPQMNGKELEAHIKRQRPDILTLFVSGYTDDIIAAHGVLEEGIHFLPKPFSVYSLIHKVRRVLDTPARGA